MNQKENGESFIELMLMSCDHMNGNLELVFYPMTDEQGKELKELHITQTNLAMRCKDCGFEFNNPYYLFNKMKWNLIQQIEQILYNKHTDEMKLKQIQIHVEMMKRENVSVR